MFDDGAYRDHAEFRCAMLHFQHFSEEKAREEGIPPRQHLLLLIVRGHRSYPNISVGDIANALQIRHHAASLLIDRGVKRGLLTRTEDPADRRRALIRLTDAGQQVLDRITRANQTQLDSLEKSLGHLRRAMEAYDPARSITGNGQVSEP